MQPLAVTAICIGTALLTSIIVTLVCKLSRKKSREGSEEPIKTANRVKSKHKYTFMNSTDNTISRSTSDQRQNRDSNARQSASGDYIDGCYITRRSESHHDDRHNNQEHERLLKQFPSTSRFCTAGIHNTSSWKDERFVPGRPSVEYMYNYEPDSTTRLQGRTTSRETNGTISKIRAGRPGHDEQEFLLSRRGQYFKGNKFSGKVKSVITKEMKGNHRYTSNEPHPECIGHNNSPAGSIDVPRTRVFNSPIPHVYKTSKPARKDRRQIDKETENAVKISERRAHNDTHYATRTQHKTTGPNGHRTVDNNKILSEATSEHSAYVTNACKTDMTETTQHHHENPNVIPVTTTDINTPYHTKNATSEVSRQNRYVQQHAEKFDSRANHHVHKPDKLIHKHMSTRENKSTAVAFSIGSIKPKYKDVQPPLPIQVPRRASYIDRLMIKSSMKNGSDQVMSTSRTENDIKSCLRYEHNSNNMPSVSTVTDAIKADSRSREAQFLDDSVTQSHNICQSVSEKSVKDIVDDVMNNSVILEKYHQPARVYVRNSASDVCTSSRHTSSDDFHHTSTLGKFNQPEGKSSQPQLTSVSDLGKAYTMHMNKQYQTQRNGNSSIHNEVCSKGCSECTEVRQKLSKKGDHSAQTDDYTIRDHSLPPTPPNDSFESECSIFSRFPSPPDDIKCSNKETQTPAALLQSDIRYNYNGTHSRNKNDAVINKFEPAAPPRTTILMCEQPECREQRSAQVIASMENEIKQSQMKTITSKSVINREDDRILPNCMCVEHNQQCTSQVINIHNIPSSTTSVTPKDVPPSVYSNVPASIQSDMCSEVLIIDTQTGELLKTAMYEPVPEPSSSDSHVKQASSVGALLLPSTTPKSETNILKKGTVMHSEPNNIPVPIPHSKRTISTPRCFRNGWTVSSPSFEINDGKYKSVQDMPVDTFPMNDTESEQHDIYNMPSLHIESDTCTSVEDTEVIPHPEDMHQTLHPSCNKPVNADNMETMPESNVYQTQREFTKMCSSYSATTVEGVTKETSENGTSASLIDATGILVDDTSCSLAKRPGDGDIPESITGTTTINWNKVEAAFPVHWTGDGSQNVDMDSISENTVVECPSDKLRPLRPENISDGRISEVLQSNTITSPKEYHKSRSSFTKTSTDDGTRNVSPASPVTSSKRHHRGESLSPAHMSNGKTFPETQVLSPIFTPISLSEQMDREVSEIVDEIIYSIQCDILLDEDKSIDKCKQVSLPRQNNSHESSLTLNFGDSTDKCHTEDTSSAHQSNSDLTIPQHRSGTFNAAQYTTHKCDDSDSDEINMGQLEYVSTFARKIANVKEIMKDPAVSEIVKQIRLRRKSMSSEKSLNKSLDPPDNILISTEETAQLKALVTERKRSLELLSSDILNQS